MTETKSKTGQRVRETWPADELYHVWAHQKAPHGRARGTNVYFTGRTIYSYGSHFPMARLVLDSKSGNPVAVLHTTYCYSRTTAGHQSSARRATCHLASFEVPNIGTEYGVADHKINLEYYGKRIAELAAKAARSRQYAEWNIRAMENMIAEANAYAKFFKLRNRFQSPKDLDKDTLLAIGEEHKKKEAAKRKKLDAEREKAYAVELAARVVKFEKDSAEYPGKLAAWLNWESDSFPSKPVDPRENYNPLSYIRPVMLRAKGSRIESSLGAVFQVDSAKPLLKLIRRPGASGVLELPDLELDGYRGGRVDYDAWAVRVGCHTVSFEECERIAKELGL